MSVPIISLPPGLAVSQASFGRVHSERVEERAQSGIEDRFRTGADRWMASFIAAPHAADRDAWRDFVMQMGETGALVYIHDINASVPYGGEKTATEYARLPYHLIDSAGDDVLLVDGSGAGVSIAAAIAAPPALDADAAVGADQVVVAGLWPGVTAIRRGAYIQIGHWLYLARADAVSGSDGVATVQIRPALWRAEGQGVAVRLTRAATVMRLDQGSSRWSGSARDRRYAISFSFREVLPQEGVPD